MTQEEVKLNIQEPGVYVIKFGSISQDKEPTPVNLTGNIDVVSTFMAARLNEISKAPSYVLVDESGGSIMLIVDENDPFKTKITGKLELHPDFVKWGINTINSTVAMTLHK